MPTQHRLSYIQGLRGIAILLVVLFHLMPQVFPGAYMGVDVFFVISGYFLIGRQLDAETGFGLSDFLKKKGVRLLIPYFALLVVVTVAAIILLPAGELEATGRLLKSCLRCKANLYLDRLSGNYFATDTRTLPLMHLWYMGVLLQCYLLFALLFAVWERCRCSRKSRIIQAAVLGVLSLGVTCLRLTPIPWEYSANTYYWTTARIWEFVLGGLLYALPVPQPRGASAAVSCGALAVLLGCSLLSVQECSWLVLLGAVCGGLLLRYGGVWQSYSPLNNTVLVWLGGISFSLYLVHWPCICFAEFIMVQQPLTYVTALPVLVLILLLSVLFYKTVEKPRSPLWVLVLLFLATVLLHRSVYKTHGYRDYLHVEANRIADAAADVHQFTPALAGDSPLHEGAEGIAPNNFTATPDPDAVLLKDIGDPARPISFVVIGDSHAIDLANGLHQLGQQHGWRGLFLNSYVTPYWNALLRREPSIAIGNFYDEDKAVHLLAWLEKHPELHTVFIAQYWSSRLVEHYTWDGTLVKGDMVQARAAELAEFCRRLKAIGKNVVIATDNPAISTESPCRVLKAHLMFSLSDELPASLICNKASYEETDGAFNRELEKLEAEGLCTLIHREQAFFKTDTFCTYDGKNVNHNDKHHLSPEGALFALSDKVEQLKKILDAPAAE